MIVTFFDVETTDLDEIRGELLTSYCVTYDVFRKSKIDELYLNYRPDRYYSESFRIHGISEEEANTHSDKWESLYALLTYFNGFKSGYFCCHANYSMFGVHSHFDRKMVKAACVERSEQTGKWFQQEFPDGKFISTHTMSKRLLGLTKNDLKSLAEHYGFEFNHHNCQEDTEVMVKIFFKLIDEYGLNTAHLISSIGHGSMKPPQSYYDSLIYNRAKGRLL